MHLSSNPGPGNHAHARGSEPREARHAHCIASGLARAQAAGEHWLSDRSFVLRHVLIIRLALLGGMGMDARRFLCFPHGCGWLPLTILHNGESSGIKMRSSRVVRGTVKQQWQ